MIAVRIGPDMRTAVAPSYFKIRPEPRRPQDLIGHNCINLRLPTRGLYAWEFEKGTRELRVRVEGPTDLQRDGTAAQCGPRGFYPSRCQSSAAFALLVDALRHRPARDGASR